MPQRKPVEIIAHRGASRERLENTMSAFQAALDQGADAFELDVHATRDGVVVVHHDPVVKTDALLGTGSKPASGMRSPNPVPLKTGSDAVAEPVPKSAPKSASVLAIADVTFAELSEMALSNGERVPTLDEVLTLAAARATVYVEIKGNHIESLVVDCLNRHPATATAVHSFDHRIPVEVGRLDRNVPLGILSSSYLLDSANVVRSAGARDYWQYWALVDGDLVDAVHSAGARVVVWTENNVDHAIELVQMGVDAICTDIPGAMRSGLEKATVLTPSPKG